MSCSSQGVHIKMNNCKLCGKSYVWPQDLKRHQKFKHKALPVKKNVERFAWKWVMSKSNVSQTILISTKWQDSTMECIKDAYMAKPSVKNEKNLYIVVNGRKTPIIFPEYELPKRRMETFRNWPKYLHPKPKRLTNAGFFYCGYSDCVQCYDCGLLLNEWKPTDNELKKHKEQL